MLSEVSWGGIFAAQLCQPAQSLSAKIKGRQKNAGAVLGLMGNKHMLAKRWGAKK
jgi:hypothetical protein